MDSKGRLWINMQNRKPEAPDYCKASSGNVFAKTWESGNPMNQAIQRIDLDLRQSAGRTLKPWENPPGWGVDIYDPKTLKFEAVDLCFGQSHAAIANDKDETIYFSLRRGGLGWLKTRVWDETHDAAKAQGWCAPVIDYNGDGKSGPFTMLNEPPDPRLDRIGTPDGYGISINPVDGSVWYAGPFPPPGRIVRAIPGPNPPLTCATEVYEPPFNNPKLPNELHYGPHGIDVDTNGIVWTALAGSGELASFDRRKCKVLNGPTATGQQCPEGWTIYPVPGPMFKGTDAHTDWHYLNWVDRYNTLGLGDNVSVVLGTSSDSLRVFTYRIPWVSIPAIWTVASTTRRQVGRGGGCGRRPKRESSGTRRAAKARHPKWCISNSGLIRLPSEASAKKIGLGRVRSAVECEFDFGLIASLVFIASAGYWERISGVRLHTGSRALIAKKEKCGANQLDEKINHIGSTVVWVAAG
jgi:hypothetical protein